MSWIPVTERDPDTSAFLVYDAVSDASGERVFVGRRAWLYRSPEGQLRMPGRHGMGVAITHWMPLPEPPQLDKSEVTS